MQAAIAAANAGYKYVAQRAVTLLGKKTTQQAQQVVKRVATSRVGQVASAVGLGAVGSYLVGGGQGRPRTRRRKMPTTKQMCSFEMAMDAMKGYPMIRKCIAYRFAGRYTWF
jgi:hypothetical protein